MPAVRKSVLIAAAALVVLAGCGGSDKIGADQASAELGLNRGAQDWAGAASTPEQPARALAQEDVAKAGGTWTVSVANCKESGPVISCDIVAKGRQKDGKRDITCSASAAVRVKNGKGTARRTPWACGGGT